VLEVLAVAAALEPPRVQFLDRRQPLGAAVRPAEDERLAHVRDERVLAGGLEQTDVLQRRDRHRHGDGDVVEQDLRQRGRVVAAPAGEDRAGVAV